MLIREIAFEKCEFGVLVRDTKTNKIIAQFVSFADADFFITMYHRMGCS